MKGYKLFTENADDADDADFFAATLRCTAGRKIFRPYIAAFHTKNPAFFVTFTSPLSYNVMVLNQKENQKE
jgi:hypothetical protein